MASLGLLAAALIGLKAAGAAIGWGIQFQQSWFLAGMALATTLFAARLWDFLPFALPQSVSGAIGMGRGRFGEALLLGAFATLLAASCSAAFLGTADQLRAPGVVAMRADWTRPDLLISADLQKFGRYGVPLDVVYGPGAPEGITLPELLTSTAMPDAFGRADAPQRQETAERTAE